MSQFIIDLFFTLIFVILAVLLMRIKERAFLENKESYRYTASGIFVLFLTSMVRLLNHQEAFTSIPFLSEPVCQDLTEAIGIVAGIALMMAGVSIWLPIKKRRTSELESEIERFTSVQKLEWEINGIEKIERLFETIPQIICDRFGFTGAAVFMRRSGDERFLCRYTCNTYLSREFHSIDYSAGDCTCDIFKKAAGNLHSDYFIPLTTGNKTRVVIYFWRPDGKAPETDDIYALEHVGRLLSDRINREYLRLKENFYERNWVYLNQIKRLTSRRVELKSNLHDFSVLFKDAVDADYFSLAVLDKAQLNMKRYTSGINRRILLEDGIRLPIEETQIGAVIRSRQSLLVKDVARSEGIKLDSLFLSCGQLSLMAIPIMNYGRVIGCLTLGNPCAGHFDRRDLLRVETMATALAPALEAAVSGSAIFERDRYLGALSAFDSIVENSTDVDSVLKSAADILMDNVRTTMVRVTAIDSSRSCLQTKALRLIRPFDNINTDDVNLSRALTPWHNMVVREGRLLLINQSDPETSLDAVEAAQLVFEGVNSALVVPIVVNGVTHGLITLGEMRNWNRFTYDSVVILFCKQIAARLASLIKMYNVGRLISSRKVFEDKREPVDDNNRHIIRQISSPLTRLRGSIDLLKMRETISDGESNRILATIEQSADNIVSLLKDDSGD